jgi:hypothetical protein
MIDKPEVKKAGGVYYTPSYIVDYIVNHTVGELVKEKTPRDVATLRILDPACGSGSFLLGAYQFLLDWHRDWYIQHLVPVFLDKKSVTDPAVLALLPEPVPRGRGKKKLTAVDPPIYKAGTIGNTTRTRSDWALTTSEKKRILINNIFGVDIDTQAVEVTKLSLLLKVLEGENRENIDQQLKLFAERALPSLHHNIQCGNALVGTDIISPQLTPDDINRINPFDWNREFASIMTAGGFDAVIGNPPYVRQEALGKLFKDYAKNTFNVYVGTADLYVYFIEKGHDLLRQNGLFGIICSNKFIKAKYGVKLREFLTTQSKLVQIVDFGELPVFQNASTFPALFLTKKGPTPDQQFVYAPIKSLQFSSLENEVTQIGHTLTTSSLTLNGNSWSLTPPAETCLLDKMNRQGIPLGTYVNGKIFYGIKTGLNTAFVIDEHTKNTLIAADPNSATIIKPLLRGDDIRRYRTLRAEKNVIFFPKGWTTTHSGEAKNKWTWLKETYPAIAQYLEPFSDAAKQRLDQGDFWWELRACEYFQEFEKPKIVWPEIAKESRMTLDVSGCYVGNSGYIIPRADLYLLGLLNSKLHWLFLKRICSCLGDPDKGGRLELFSLFMVRLPIRAINFSDTADTARHDRMVSLVTQILDLNKRLQDAKVEHEKTLLQRQIVATDAAIDALVYELYGLTAEEIQLVESRAG